MIASAARSALLALTAVAVWPATPASAAPGADVGAATAADPILGTVGRGYIQTLGGFLHFFDNQWYFVSTTELGAELAISPTLSWGVVAPLIVVERDGEIAPGWGNLGASIRLHGVHGTGDGRWQHAVELYISGPTATDRGRPGFAARSAATMHDALDFGEFYPGASTARVTGTLRLQRPRWSVTGMAGYRFHFLTYDQGETEFLEILVAVVDVGYQLAPRWQLGAGVETTSTVLEERWADGDLFRHIAHIDVAHSTGMWRVSGAVLIPLDFVLRDDQSPMVAVEVSRQFGP